jgi:hypothetical protein
MQFTNVVGLALAALLFCPGLYGQDARGRIAGRVIDPSLGGTTDFCSTWRPTSVNRIGDHPRVAVELESTAPLA